MWIRPCSPLPPSPILPAILFCVCVGERKAKTEKTRVSKQKLSKDCDQGQNATVLTILERLEFKKFSCQSTMVAEITFQYSVAPLIGNSFRLPCDKNWRIKFNNTWLNYQARPIAISRESIKKKIRKCLLFTKFYI